MKLSQTTDEKINALSDGELEKIVFEGTEDGGERADVALLLGTRPAYAAERADTAAELYLSGRVPYVIPSGGVKWDVGGKQISEARFMADILVSRGVPADAIILEEEALTTKENMIFGTLTINRRLKIQNVKSCIIVTSASHLRRSLALAKLYLPRSIKISGCPAPRRDAWRTDKGERDRLVRETELLRGLIRYGLIDEIEY